MRTLSLLTICLALKASVSAQDPTDRTLHEPPVYAMIDDSLGHALGLTNEQMKLVQAADENYRKSSKAGDAGAMEKRERDLKAVLLPSQYAQWKEVIKGRKSGPTEKR